MSSHNQRPGIRWIPGLFLAHEPEETELEHLVAIMVDHPDGDPARLVYGGVSHDAIRIPTIPSCDLYSVFITLRYPMSRKRCAIGDTRSSASRGDRIDTERGGEHERWIRTRNGRHGQRPTAPKVPPATPTIALATPVGPLGNGADVAPPGRRGRSGLGSVYALAPIHQVARHTSC